jgi:hypothetical protein
MAAIENLILEATRELASRLASAPKFKARSGAGEAENDPPPSIQQRMPGTHALGALARQLVDTVLELSGSGLNSQQMDQAIRQAARDYLSTRTGGHDALQTRLSSELPRLLNLAHLARLSREDLSLEPGALPGMDSGAVVGASPVFTLAVSKLEAVAHTDFPVLNQW